MMEGNKPVKTPLTEEQLHDKPGQDGLKPRILVAPLDWGLGHTTRCIPIVRELLAQGVQVFFAGNNKQIALIKNEFSGINCLYLEGYNIRYAGRKRNFSLKILLQVPAILRNIKNENQWLKKAMEEYAFDGIISDNRYGLHHKNAYCVFITHQLAIKTSLGKLAERYLRYKNYSYIRKFDACWVPDEVGEINLAGKLSHPEKMPTIPLRYIGILSRFRKMELPVKKDHLLILVSGPEPQRKKFEDLMLDQLMRYHGTASFVRGLPDSEKILPSTNNFLIYNHLPGEKLNEEIMQAEYIIARCGYSTVMDLAMVQKRSILIPTPGQTEQEWLAGYGSEKKFALCLQQKGFSLSAALQSAASFPYYFPEIFQDNKLKRAIAEFLQELRTRQKR